ncbi:bifunctional helix-turn-helix transcriptional regulator/GNAT family N-acetyltransferase [Muribaculum intestinale]|uniref:bifunctional helix-turn-helix transcriptional regulator/GNAT family N-acetyltransferase n=1 Tax=Muribaculum intestinale TaxID=1796646 RepID=UPI0025A997EF|nr:bifunctional helix-turn-helix transcriptional regulator/GNAT family N-acetyltransferase [Muribaculum intestinale]
MMLFEKSGLLAIGSRLRWLADVVTRDAAEIYRMYDVDIKPKWFPVLYMLFDGTDCSVTGIAKAIGQTHPSVSSIVKELKAAGLVSDGKSEEDRRATVIALTDRGMELRSKLHRVCTDVENAVRSIESQASNRLWQALDNWEDALAEKSLLKRVEEERTLHGSRNVEIVDYRPEHLMTFKRLNIMWINSHWSLEAHDLEVLNDPDASILAGGGYIFVALVNGEPMGVVALCRMDGTEYDFELAKLAVDPDARGTGVGEKICRAALERARQCGARKIFLESNTILKLAISLYRKLGFTELKEYHPAYERGDIQMELTL